MASNFSGGTPAQNPPRSSEEVLFCPAMIFVTKKHALMMLMFLQYVPNERNISSRSFGGLSRHSPTTCR